MTDTHLIVIAGLWLAGLSFLIYVIETVVALRVKPVAESKEVAKQAGMRAGLVADNIPKPTIPEFTALMEGLAKLIDSLSKAGPALTSIAASILFLLIAAIGAGAFQGTPKDNKGNQTQQARVDPKDSVTNGAGQAGGSGTAQTQPAQDGGDKLKAP
jgi:hypothetical protein